LDILRRKMPMPTNLLGELDIFDNKLYIILNCIIYQIEIITN